MIRTKPTTDKFRKGFDNIRWESKKCKPKRVPKQSNVYVTNDPHFGG